MRDKLFLKLFWDNSSKVSQEEVEYFANNPDEIDEFTTPLNIHKIFLTIGIMLGIVLVTFSKLIKYNVLEFFETKLINEIIIDLVFEIGIALIGAAVTAYLLGVLLNRQQSNAKKWRNELRKKIKQFKKTK